MIEASIFKVGERVLVRFKRWDGSWHRKIGTITRLWGKRPHAATVRERDGEIRAAMQDLVKLK